MVMVLLGLFVTIMTLQIACGNKMSGGNGVNDCVMSLTFIGEFQPMSARTLTHRFFAYLGLCIFVPRKARDFSTRFGLQIFPACTTLNYFTFFSLAINFLGGFTAFLAPNCQTVCSPTPLVKFNSRQKVVALGTSFRYDLISHFRLLFRRYWLGPVEAYTASVGPFNITSIREFVQ
jgi:hypothetical protein